ncbi:Hypothetical protein R9X50_00103700 [Acrodontium crateriforme]|uniref:OPT superfamily oligopeptide transporter n=1 Tax=Acrodontium crateriforme TaxID=150365 RepID=A0AAQ3LZZ5_9PEZI|nr:Hypothetical protein R9X50_00103700 [Acrodontium crateriforme]
MEKRPGFPRADTDHHGASILNPSSKDPDGKNTYESSDKDAKSGPCINQHTNDEVPAYEKDDFAEGESAPVETALDVVTKIVHVEDDQSLNPITFRTIFLGTGLSIFGSVLQEIFYFKPQTIFVSIVFLTVIAYVLGDLLALVIPRKGFLKYLNPGPFNSKEHAAITIMASAASQSALSTEALAAQQLYYGGYPSKAAGIFITLSSQLLGFGVAGLLRSIIVHPTKMIWPITLPVSTLLETIHRDRAETKHRMRVWYIVFFALFFWEILPEYVFPLTAGVSVFCLADQHSMVFTHLFGGASGNEGLGALSLGLDWNYIAAFFSPLWYPLQTTVNANIGIFGCYILFMGIYYGNIWRSQQFPFLSQSLYNISSDGFNYNVYNQSLILNDKFEIDFDQLDVQGTPWLTGSYLGYLITSNCGMTATIVYMVLWNRDDLKSAWSWCSFSNLKKLGNPRAILAMATETREERNARIQDDPDVDPHYKLMMRNGYKEVPRWWWLAILISSFIVGLVCLYVMKSTLPWWGFIIAIAFTFLFTLFFGAQQGLTGFGFNLQPICQMLAGYMFPGRPLANFYFTCFTYNTTVQSSLLAKDLRLAQYTHLSPVVTFWLQCAGCVVGALMNWVMMITIVQNQAPALLDIESVSVWSGQNVQQFNSLAIAWSIAPKMFSVGAKYEWVTLAFLIGFIVPVPFYIMYRITGNKGWGYLNPSIILWFMGNLFVGVNSSFTTFFLCAYFSQFYLRRKHPEFFVKYNYLISAAMDGGTQVMVFILTFAVAGGSGVAHPMPVWAGAPDQSLHNNDWCKKDPGTVA